MSWNLWLLYVSLAAVVIVSPGPSALLCVSHAVSHGARKTVATIVGGITASMTLMTLSALGLGAVIAASDVWFQTIKWAGAAYLVYLGISAWRTQVAQPTRTPSTQAASAAAVAVPAASQPGTSGWKLYRKGFMVGIGNPKDLLFFSALFPQFMDASAPIAMQMLILGATWMVLDGSIMFAYALCGVKVMARFGHGGAGQWFHRITGGAFIAAAGVLASTHR
jgi:homoserine/homoserine lactone efflux protein